LVQKSARRHVVTLAYGPFVARETIRVCRARCTYPSGALVTVRAGGLSRLVGAGATFGYDVEVFVGIERFVHHRQRDEIREELSRKYGISISSGEVTQLASRFCAHLAGLHHLAEPLIRDAFCRDGGYPLHIDATGEAGRGTLFVAYAGWRKWVLGAWKLPTERADAITPRLEEIQEAFGSPCALMRDLGRAVTLAAEDFVSGLETRVPILSCHEHFLADVGKDLLNAHHQALRNLFRRFRLRPKLRSFVRDLGRRLGGELPDARGEAAAWIRSSADEALPGGRAGLVAVRSLAQWALDYAQDGDNLGFPFERPYLEFYRRSRTLRRAIDGFLRQGSADAGVGSALRRLARILEPVVAEGAFADVAKLLRRRARLFDALRSSLRLTPKSQSDLDGLLAEEAAAELKDIRRELAAFIRSLHSRRLGRGCGKDERKAIDMILQHLERHGRTLWGHVIRLPRRAGGGIRLVSRTNGLVETFFNQLKHGERRRSGRKALTDDLEHLPPEAALAYNLTRADYVELVCGSLEKLPELFADLDMRAREMVLCDPELAEPEQTELPAGSLSREDRAIVRADVLRARIETAARDCRHRVPTTG